MAKTPQGQLRTELLKGDGGFDISNVQVHDDEDDGDDGGQPQQIEPVPMGFGYMPQMAQVGQGKIPGLPPGVPGLSHAAPGSGSMAPFAPKNNSQQNMGSRPNTMMRKPYRSGMPPNGMPPASNQRRAYSLTNVWKQRPKISYRNRESGDNEDEEVILQENGEDVTFNDIRTMGKSDIYGFEADTSPIIPTLITKSHNNMNNTEYRKAMTAQRKHAINAMSRQRQTAHFNAAARLGPDPRSMSLQGYGRGSPFNPMAPNGFPNGQPSNAFGPVFAGNAGNAMIPPNMPRSMSMMSVQNNRPPMGYMRQRQQSMLAARGGEMSLTGPPRQLKLGPNPQVQRTLDPGPVTPDIDQPNNKHVMSPLKNEVMASSPVSPPLTGGQLNVLQLSQPQQNELKEREKKLAEREKELKEKEEMINKREAEMKEELKQREEELEHERLRKDQEEIQRQEQREQIEPLEENPLGSNFTRVPPQRRLSHPQGLNSIASEDGLDLQPSLTLERGLDATSLGDKSDLRSAADKGKDRPHDSNRDSVPCLKGLPHNSRMSTSTFMSTLSDSPQKKANQITGLYKLENSEFFTAEDFLGSKEMASNPNSANASTSAINGSESKLSKNLYSDNKAGHGRNGSNKKLLSKISSASSKENESNSGGAPDSFSRNSVSNVSVGSLPSSNDDTFDFKRGDNDASLVQASSKNPQPTKKDGPPTMDGGIEAFSFDNTVRQLYEPMFAHGSELAPSNLKFKTIVISTEQLNILKENKSLLSEISIVSAELADSIRRECVLEEKLRALSDVTCNNKDICDNSLLEYESQLRSKSNKIVELLKKLNEQRLKRLIAEEQLLLSENGVKPSSIELVHKILSLESQLEEKDQEIEHLKENNNDSL